MALAVSLGTRGLGQTWPNPAVGCVVVKDGRVVGRGWTQPGGRPHAERVALDQAGSEARGATAYVTLEPCAHHGKTPPCAAALVHSGVSRVVCALQDPDPRVSGRGFAILRAAGIEVVEDVLREVAEHAQRGFLKRVTQGLPLVTLKLATSLDGRIALASGESKWITGPQARRAVHAMRARHDGVFVGAGTARADDPSLTVRGLGVEHQPVRIVVSGQLNLPRDSALAHTARQVPVWLLHAPGADREAWSQTGAELVEVALGTDGLVNMETALRALAARGMTRVFVEGGGQIAAALLKANLVDDVVLFSAGLALGADARAGLGPLGWPRLADAHRFDLLEHRAVGPDLMQIWTRH